MLCICSCRLYISSGTDLRMEVKYGNNIGIFFLKRLIRFTVLNCDNMYPDEAGAPQGSELGTDP